MNPYHNIPGLKSQRFRDITCWIEAEDGPKYVSSPVRSSETNSSTGWIESIAGQSFVVKWHNNRREVPLEGRLYIDGILCDTHILPDGLHYPDSRWATTTISFAQTSPYTRRNFVFANIAKDEGESEEYSPVDARGTMNQLGTIKLEIRRVQLDSRRVAWDHINPGENIQNNQPQGIFNDLSHQVRLGEEQKGHVYNVVVARGRPIDINPWYSFIFKYRPRDILIANNLIPAQFLPLQPNPEDAQLSPTEIKRITERILSRRHSPSVKNSVSGSSTVSSRVKEKIKERSANSNSPVKPAESQQVQGGSRKGGGKLSEMKKRSANSTKYSSKC